jgi:hypothetical protein
MSENKNEDSGAGDEFHHEYIRSNSFLFPPRQHSILCLKAPFLTQPRSSGLYLLMQVVPKGDSERELAI